MREHLGLPFDRQLIEADVLRRFRVRGDRPQTITEQVRHGAIRGGDPLDISDRADSRGCRHLAPGRDDDVRCRAQRSTIDRTEWRPRLPSRGARLEMNQRCEERQPDGSVHEAPPANPLRHARHCKTGRPKTV